MNRLYIPVLAILVCLFTVRCATSKITNAPKPQESYNKYEDTPLLSYLTIPVLITVDDLVYSLNKSTSGEALYEELFRTEMGTELVLKVHDKRFSK